MYLFSSFCGSIAAVTFPTQIWAAHTDSILCLFWWFKQPNLLSINRLYDPETYRGPAPLWDCRLVLVMWDYPGLKRRDLRRVIGSVRRCWIKRLFLQHILGQHQVARGSDGDRAPQLKPGNTIIKPLTSGRYRCANHVVQFHSVLFSVPACIGQRILKYATRL